MANMATLVQVGITKDFSEEDFGYTKKKESGDFTKGIVYKSLKFVNHFNITKLPMIHI